MRKLAALAAVTVALPAQQALACAVCFSGRDETRVAYLATTIFMTSLPLFALAAGIVWVIRKANAADRTPPR
jgi:hypothetical protein